jgi:hypothetical protein
MSLPKKPTREDREDELTANSLKGDYSSNKRAENLFRLVNAIPKTVIELGDGESGPIGETKIMHKLIPESIGKTGKELEPYTTKFNDAMYIYLRMFETRTKSKYIKELYVAWKADHGR